MSQGVYGFVVGGGSWRFVAIFDELVGKEIMASGLAAGTFFADIGFIDSNVENHVADMVVECGIAVDCHVV